MNKKVVVPSPPGIYALSVLEDGALGNPKPVIAWEVIYDDLLDVMRPNAQSALPILPGGFQVVDYLLYPDGRVDEIGGTTWISLDAANSDKECFGRIS